MNVFTKLFSEKRISMVVGFFKKKGAVWTGVGNLPVAISQQSFLSQVRQMIAEGLSTSHNVGRCLIYGGGFLIVHLDFR